MKALLAGGVMILSLLAVLYFVWLSQEAPVVGPVGVVIPHHDMVASARSAYLEQVSPHLSPETIVLLSPDHFGTNLAPLVASTKVWETSVGTLAPDLELIETLKLPKDIAHFSGEHGVTTVLRDIRTYFPESQILPIMVDSRITYEEITRFVTDLYSTCPECLLVASVDFSHTSHSEVADLHDLFTERELQQRDAEALYSGAEVDSGASLAALALWAELHGAERFLTFSHTNSGYITGRAVGEMTTHIIGGYEYGEAVTTHDDTVTLQFGGDVMFARGVAEVHRARPALALSGSLGERFFWGVDAAIVNFEGVFSRDREYFDGWNEYPPQLRFAPIFVKALEQARISAVSMANNHRFDGGEGEYNETIQLLKKNGITPLTNRSGDNPEVQIITQGDTQVVILTIATHGETKDLAPVIQKYADQEYVVVVYAHWGNEYDLTPTSDQEAMARRWIDAGAKLVVGTHPHVVQPVAVYNGVPIVYSLGNLLFDQTEPDTTQTGAVLGASVTSEGIKVFLVPVGTYLRPQAIEYDTTSWTAAWLPYMVEGEGEAYLFTN
jgi:AmmeMemoRadiSam system protein B